MNTQGNGQITGEVGVEKTDSRTAQNAWDCLGDADEFAARNKARANSLAGMHRYFNELVSGDPDQPYLNYFREHYLLDKEPLAIASFGSGGGHLERTLIEFGYQCDSIVGYELNPRLVEASNNESQARGFDCLTYEEQDMNAPSLPHAQFDVGVFFHSLHHVENLEACLAAVDRSIKDDGLLLIVEYVGPNFLQYTDEQVQVANAMLSLLPKRYRRMGSASEIKESVHRPTVDEVVKTDPSECVRSSDIEELLHQQFLPLEWKPMGSTVLELVLLDIAQNFDESRQEDRDLLDLLQKLERWYVDNGQLSSNFMFGVFAKRSS